MCQPAAVLSREPKSFRTITNSCSAILLVVFVCLRLSSSVFVLLHFLSLPFSCAPHLTFFPRHDTTRTAEPPELLKSLRSPYHSSILSATARRTRSRQLDTCPFCTGLLPLRKSVHELFIFPYSASGIFKLAMRQSPRLQQRGMENGHIANGVALSNGHAIVGEALQKIGSNIQKQENIFLFIPNIIGKHFDLRAFSMCLTLLGYTRIILALSSLYYMPLHPRTCSVLYSLSCILDALDGLAARHYNQSTTFGAVLDMVTDRCTTSCLLVFLASAFPRWSIVFQGLISLDLASHYIHMYATLAMGASGQSHKKVDSSRSWVLHLYYTNRVSLHG